MSWLKLGNIFVLVLLILIAVPGIVQLFKPGFFISDDATWMVIRFSAFYEELINGQFPVRFLNRLNNGYGYPVANFLYPGFMYLAAPIKFLGFTYVDTIKIIIGASFISSGIFTYYWLRKFFDLPSSLAGALFYLYTPYHIYDMYKRGSVGEMLSLAIIPFILLFITKKSKLFTSLGIGMLLISHNTLAFLFLPIIFAYALVSKSFSLSTTTILFALGILLSSFFWIPAALELSNTDFQNVTISNPTEYFADFTLIGLSSFTILILTVLIIVKIIIQKTKPVGKNIFISFTVVGVLSILLATSVSQPIWGEQLTKFVQFPFRLLSIVIVCISFIAAFTFFHLHPKIRILALFIFGPLLVVSSWTYLSEIEPEKFADTVYSTNRATTTVHDEYMPIWVEEKPEAGYEEKVMIIGGEAEITELSVGYNTVDFISEASQSAFVQINTIYYPGWNVHINGEATEISYDNNPQGVMQFEVPEGTNRVEVSFSETVLRFFADALSIIALVVLILYASGQTQGLRMLFTIWKK